MADGISFSIETARWYPADYYPRHVKTWLITTIQNIFVRVPSFPQLVAFGSSRLSTGPNDTQDKGKDMQSVVGYIWGAKETDIPTEKETESGYPKLSRKPTRPGPTKTPMSCTLADERPFVYSNPPKKNANATLFVSRNGEGNKEEPVSSLS
jgi:hypothetical protein